MASEASKDKGKQPMAAVAAPVAGSTGVTPPTGAVTKQGSNPRGIPKAVFIESEADFMKKEGKPADQVLAAIDEHLRKFKYMEVRTIQRKAHLKRKQPDLEKSLDLLSLLKEKSKAGEALTTQYQLSSNVFAKATIKKADKADVMLEYSLDEAEELLNKNLSEATRQLQVVDEDLDFLREQITITEVNIARIYNHDVKSRRGKQASAEE